MGTTANRAYRYPASTDDVRVYEDIQNLATDVDTDLKPVLNDGYTSYTPTWSSGGVAPSIGNGTISGKYKQVGKKVHCHVEVTFGSTTTFGTGSYTFSLPVTANATLAAHVGSAYFRDASGTATGHYNGISALSGTTGLTGFESSGHTQLQATVPVTWVNGDFFRFDIEYEAA